MNWDIILPQCIVSPRRDPRPFFKFAREIYPGQFSPSPCHRFIAALESGRKLLRNYTQNIDTLEQEAGISKVVSIFLNLAYGKDIDLIYFQVVQCHGSFATASCTVCKVQVPADAIREDIFERRIPLCSRCKDVGEEGESKETTASTPVEPSASPEPSSISGKASTSSAGVVGAESDLEVPETSANAAESCDKPSEPSYVPPKSVMKPDIVFFGEGLPDHFHQVFLFNTPGILI